ncbi:hypothetical protein DSO57_1020386 [Entomophthora muscae]|uniref:Uncharacterized protein n=1 Tax=Entomophthora muscae TaxID=34485 RepID=A0ACC2UNV2_9FUNG|nr:hypothetical protein DSO57_1020386 [Entomophthora muscae]
MKLKNISVSHLTSLQGLFLRVRHLEIEGKVNSLWNIYWKYARLEGESRINPDDFIQKDGFSFILTTFKKLRTFKYKKYSKGENLAISLNIEKQLVKEVMLTVNYLSCRFTFDESSFIVLGSSTATEKPGLQEHLASILALTDDTLYNLKVPKSISVHQLELTGFGYTSSNQHAIKNIFPFLRAKSIHIHDIPLNMNICSASLSTSLNLHGASTFIVPLESIKAGFPNLKELSFHDFYHPQTFSDELKFSHLETITMRSSVSLAFWKKLIPMCPQLKLVNLKLYINTLKILRKLFPNITFKNQ